MFVEFRTGVLLLVSLGSFLIIIAIFALSMVMRPDRWSQRTRLATGVRSTARNGLSVSA